MGLTFDEFVDVLFDHYLLHPHRSRGVAAGREASGSDAFELA
jgi:hypothetical protein